MRPLFLTGGTGLVGSHVAAAWRAHGGRVRMLCRASGAPRDGGPKGEGARDPEVEIVEGDLRTLSTHDLKAAMAGCGALVHAAAISYSTLPWAEVHALNVDATARVMDAALGANVRRVVHLSSLAVHGDPETGALRPFEQYARSKRAGEAVARARFEVEGGASASGASGAASRGHAAAGASLVILRPGAVHGERDRLFTPMMARWLRAPVHLLPGGGRAPIPLLYAGNLADLVVRILLAPNVAPGVSVYDVPHDHRVGQRDVLEALAQATGQPLRPLSLPVGLAEVGARVLEALGVRIPGSVELPLSRATRFAGRGHPFDGEAVRRAFDWMPPVSATEGLARTARWWREQGAA